MPRRNRRQISLTPDEGDEGGPFAVDLKEKLLAPGAARLEGFEVRLGVTGLKRYRCPYCGGWVEPGIAHTVAFAVGAVQDRRHYHYGCWIKQAKAAGKAPRP